MAQNSRFKAKSSHHYGYSRPYFYYFLRIFPPVLLFQTVRLFQYLEYPTYFGRTFFIFHYHILGKFQIFKCWVIFFLFYNHFSWIHGLGTSIAEFGSEGHEFKSWSHHFFFIGKEIWAYRPQIQSQLCLHLGRRERFFLHKRILTNSTWWKMFCPPTMGNQLENTPW